MAGLVTFSEAKLDWNHQLLRYIFLNLDLLKYVENSYIVRKITVYNQVKVLFSQWFKADSGQEELLKLSLRCGPL